MGIRVRARRLLAPLGVVCLAACASSAGVVSTLPPGPSPAGHAYVVVGASGLSLPEGSALRIEFTATSLRISGGCNDIGGEFRLSASVLVVSQLSSTERGCDRPLMDLDTAVMAFIADRPTFVVTGNQLTLTAGAVVLNFHEATPVPDLPLEGTHWTVTGTTQGDATSTLNTTPATVVFSQGTAEVFAGCNRGTVAYRVTGNEIVLGPLRLGQTVCAAAATRLEDTVTQVLDGTVGFDIEGTKLTITHGDTGLTLSGAP